MKCRTVFCLLMHVEMVGQFSDRVFVCICILFFSFFSFFYRVDFTMIKEIIAALDIANLLLPTILGSVCSLVSACPIQLVPPFHTPSRRLLND